MAQGKPATDHLPARADHILAFAQTLNGGGVERALLRMAGGWVDRGRRVTLLLGDSRGPLASELPASVTCLPGGGGGYRAMMAAAARSVRDARPDLIFCPGNHYTGVALAARPFARAPIVGKLSNALAGTHRGLTGWGYARWLGLHPHFIDHLVTMTPAMAAEAAVWMKLPPARISVIANPPALPRAGALLPPLPPGRFILGVGRLAPQKRWDRLIAALAYLPPDVSLVILGEGALRDALAAQAAQAGVGARVHLPGHVPDPLPAMARATVLALTSDYEGVPGAIGEALSQGTPVVTTDSSVAIPELIDAPTKGSIVGRDDAAALIAALDRWLTPGIPRPTPNANRGDPVGDYLALFDRLVSARRQDARR